MKNRLLNRKIARGGMMRGNIVRYIYIIQILVVAACTSNRDRIEEDIFRRDQVAQWISDTRPLPDHDSLFYTDHPAPLFRKEFKVEKDIEFAKLFITAAGYYHASLNGERIGKNVLDPAWTDFSKRIYYAEYDVLNLLSEGVNCLGVTLGNGFYNPLPLRMWGRRNLRNNLSVGNPVFIAKLRIQYKNGILKEIVSDSTWKHAYGPIIKNNVYLGTVYDLRKEIQGWDTPGFNDELWKQVGIFDGPGGQIQETFFPSVRVTEKIIPVGIDSPERGVYVVDMGINFTGTYKIRMSGNYGDTITFRFGERIYDDGTLNPMTTVAGQIKRKGVGGPGAPDIAWQTDRYIFGNDSMVFFTPEFTFHTYRYMEIEGLKEIPDISDITGLFMHSDVEQENNFSCSSHLLNSIQNATDRTFRANLVSVQSDCPAREKFGYGGDLNATSESYIYNYDMQSFYRKTIYDWVDAMNDSVFIDAAPYVGIRYCGLSWESAFLITQYYLYLYYNDIEIVEELYALDKKWMDKAARIHPGGLVDKGLSDHESLEPVPVELTGTCHYLQSARIMATFASVMGDSEGEKEYEALAEWLKCLIKKKFWDNPADKNINRQTLFSTLLYHNIVPDDEVHSAADSLVKAVKNGPEGHFNTGIFGTKYVLETLSEKVSPEMVYHIINSTTYPGWGYMIDRGATTIWETWKESDNTYSNCHPMFGSVSEWFYRWLGGIRPDPEYPGFKEFIVAPYTPDDVEFVNCTYHSPFGQIVSNWSKDQNGEYRYKIRIPEGSTARVDLSLVPGQKVEIQRTDEPVDPGKIESLQTGRFKLGTGEYRIILTSLQ